MSFASGLSTPKQQPARMNYSSATPLLRPPTVFKAPVSRRRTPVGTPSRGNSGRSSPTRSVSSEYGTGRQPTVTPYSGSINVTVRVKPSETGVKDPWFYTSATIGNGDGEYSFDNVFHPSCTNYDIHEKVSQPLLEKYFLGFNATVFAYGMTGSGKTHSMSGTAMEPGLIPLCIDEVFRQISDAVLKVSYLEIYNEKVYDLLQNANVELRVYDDPVHGTKVHELSEETVTTKADVMSIIQRGNSNRRTGKTDYNSRSSRSHAIVSLKLMRGESVSTFSFCDLAGSERATQQEERRKEGNFINKSLLALGNVISKLSAPQQPGVVGHISYRDSKLTRILQPALSGESIVSILCTVQTQPGAAAETFNTLRFAQKAKNISQVVRRSLSTTESDKEYQITQYKKQIDELQEELTRMRLKVRGSSGTSLNAGGLSSSALGQSALQDELAQSKAENRVLHEKLEHYSRLLDKRGGSGEMIMELLSRLPSNHAVDQLREYCTMQYQDMQEYQSYISHLESELNRSEYNKANQRSVSGSTVASTSTTIFSPIATRNDISGEVELLMHEQEREIMELKEALERKDKLINAFKSAKKARDSITHRTTINSNFLEVVPESKLNASVQLK